MVNEQKNPRRSVLLIILDGFGVNPSRLNNGIAQANTPRFDEYFSHYPHTLLQASSAAVGLPEGQMGNSEVGHLTMGCGTIVRQDLVHINDSIKNGSFYENPALCASMDAARLAGHPLHLIGLVSDGGVHSHVQHLLALIELCHSRGCIPALHMITDGRDTPPKSIRNYLSDVESALQRVGGSIATVTGRYYAMDRDKRWDRTQAAWQAMVQGEGRHAENIHQAIELAYAQDEGDEFIRPTVLKDAALIQAGDYGVFFNFRKDRPRQLVSALCARDFNEFDRGDFQPIVLTCMTQYDKWYELPYAFEQERPAVTLADVVSQTGLRQFHCAETEKYAHVTYFFNGGRGDAVPGEDRVIIDSPKVATYDLAPEMSASIVADTVIDALRSKSYDFIVVNFANGDMVGHTANREAIIRAVETLDHEVGRVLDTAVMQDYSVILTADHGNCEEIVDPVTGDPQTQHTVYPVPCMIIDKVPWQLGVGAGLGSIAPTVLQLMGLKQPVEMTGESLLIHQVQQKIERNTEKAEVT